VKLGEVSHSSFTNDKKPLRGQAAALSFSRLKTFELSKFQLLLEEKTGKKQNPLSAVSGNSD